MYCILYFVYVLLMKWLLKCYYGYRNRGDELLFFGVVKYLFNHYEDLTVLDIEVGDVSWMNQWCKMNPWFREPHKDRVRFVSSRRFSMWVADYDIIYLWWGEVLAAQTRSFWHGGVNYLALFWRWIWSGRVVRLWGIETPVARWSKLLYRMMLPYACEIVCREQGSYEIARRYTDKVVLYHDWAIDVLEEATSTHTGIKGSKRQQKYRQQKLLLLHGKKRPQTNEVDGWIKWTWDQLTDQWLEVKTPFVDKTREIWRSGREEILDSYENWIDENTILVWHSAGAAAIVRWLWENHRTIKKLILVAPWYIPRPYEKWRTSTQTGEILTEDADAGMRNLYSFTIDPTIKDFVCEWIIVFTSNDEDRLLQSAEKYILALNANHVAVDDRWHFNGSYGRQNETFVELVEEIVGENNSHKTAHVAVPTKSYILINFIPKHTSPEIVAQFHEWIQDYPDHQIMNFPAEEWDALSEEIVTQYWDRIQTWKRWEHDIGQSLVLFQQTDAGFGQRLHFILSCIYYGSLCYRLHYSEKIHKILRDREDRRLGDKLVDLDTKL